MNYLVQKYYQLGETILKLIYLNLLWYLFVFLGLIAFGIIPSTMSLFYIYRKNIHKQSFKVIFREYLQYYKSYFIRANIYGVVFTAAAYLLLVLYFYLQNPGTTSALIAYYIVVVLMIVFCAALIYFFPIYVHFKLDNFALYLKWPLTVALLNPAMTLMLLFGAGVVNYVVFKYLSGIWIFFGVSMNIYLIQMTVQRIYYKYEA